MTNMNFNKTNVFINKEIKNKKDAINFVGKYFLKNKMIHKEYIKNMFERDKIASVNIGNYLAIPHSEKTKHIIKEGIVFFHSKDSFDWDGSKVKFIIGLALKPGNQIDFLSLLGTIFGDINNLKNILKNNIEKKDIYDLFEESR